MMSRATSIEVGQRFYPLGTWPLAVLRFNMAGSMARLKNVAVPEFIYVVDNHGNRVGRVYADRVVIGTTEVYRGRGGIL